MRLEEIQIRNFKGLREETFEPSSFACLVGENNAGKSTVLQALVSSLNRPTRMSSGLYYDEQQPVEFRLRFSGVSKGHLYRLEESHRGRVETLLEEESLTLLVRYPPGDTADLKVVRLLPRDERLYGDGLTTLFRGVRGRAVREVFEREFPEFLDDLPDGANATQAKAYVTSLIPTFAREDLVERERPLPSGIPSSISNLLPEPIYIPAVKDLNDEVKTTQATSFGRLIGLLVEDLEPDLENFNRALDDLDRMLNLTIVGEEERDERHEKVRQLEGTVEEYLSRHFSRAKVRLKIPPPELKTVLNSAEIWIDDGALDLIENKGDGIRRSLTFALLRAYVDRLEQNREKPSAKALPRPLLFLFEEPELFLHPRSQRLLFRMLDNISQDHQVVVTTHSPLFFAPGATASFVRVAKKDTAPKPVGVLNPVNFSLDQGSAEAFRLARFENTDAAFFSSKVVLFEGESDDHFIRHVGKKLDSEWDLERKNISFVRVSGKGNFSRYRDFFRRFGIEVVVVADLDALFDGFEHLGASPDTIRLRGEALTQLDARINELGLKPEVNGRRIKKKVRQGHWVSRYQAVRDLVERFQDTGEVPPELGDRLAALFSWEQDDARLQSVRTDEQCLRMIVPVIDALRDEGISLLARGALEDYYPPDVPGDSSKPQRALLACEKVVDRDAAVALSEPLRPDRESELEEVIQSILAFPGGGANFNRSPSGTDEVRE
jgi:putative ATP-dependent endonuclease of the OLD family